MFVTRHAQSCNNIANAANKVAEPSLTENGIEDAKKHSEKHFFKKDFEHVQREELAKYPRKLQFFGGGTEESRVVYVSPLIRTWMTAVLLYSDFEHVDLRICSCLKEYHNSSIDLGNLPASPKDQITSFMIFVASVSEWLKQKNVKRISVTFFPTQKGEGSEQQMFEVVLSGDAYWLGNVAQDFTYPPSCFVYKPDGVKLLFDFWKGSSETTLFAVSHHHLMGNSVELEKKEVRSNENMWTINFIDKEDQSKVEIIHGIVGNHSDLHKNYLCSRNKKILSVMQRPRYTPSQTTRSELRPDQAASSLVNKKWWEFWRGGKKGKTKNRKIQRHKRSVKNGLYR
jgi:hypothetical protein